MLLKNVVVGHNKRKFARSELFEFMFCPKQATIHPFIAKRDFITKIAVFPQHSLIGGPLQKFLFYNKGFKIRKIKNYERVILINFTAKVCITVNIISDDLEIFKRWDARSEN